MSGLLFVLVVPAVFAVCLIGVYNRIVTLNEPADQSFVDVDVQRNQRHDLIPTLVETVKGYAAHEQESLDAVITARSAAASAHGHAAQGQAEGTLGEQASLGARM